MTRVRSEPKATAEPDTAPASGDSAPEPDEFAAEPLTESNLAAASVEALRQPLDRTRVKKRDGRGGGKFEYVAVQGGTAITASLAASTSAGCVYRKMTPRQRCKYGVQSGIPLHPDLGCGGRAVQAARLPMSVLVP